jgi:hypothetical protein
MSKQFQHLIISWKPIKCSYIVQPNKQKKKIYKIKKQIRKENNDINFGV